jgi:hypothetical protein
MTMLRGGRSYMLNWGRGWQRKPLGDTISIPSTTPPLIQFAKHFAAVASHNCAQRFPTNSSTPLSVWHCVVDSDASSPSFNCCAALSYRVCRTPSPSSCCRTPPPCGPHPMPHPQGCRSLAHLQPPLVGHYACTLLPHWPC